MAYETPEITDHGRLEDLTAGQVDGDYTDRDFPANTPRGDLTFS